MKKIIALAFLLSIVMVLPSFAGTRACNTALVNQNVCRSISDVVYNLSVGTTDPDGAGPRLAPHLLIADAFASLGNWQSSMSCVDDMVSVGICTSGQLNTLVPVSKSQFFDLQIRRYVLSQVLVYIRQKKAAAAEAEAASEAAPDIGN